ncbi:MAG: glycine cleavage system protein H [Acidobacteriota bacterium]
MISPAACERPAASGDPVSGPDENGTDGDDHPSASSRWRRMRLMTGGFLAYRRARFASRFPTDRLYTPGHFWLGRQDTGLWRVGLTKFALRMLGEPVEIDFEVEPGASVEVGSVVGWLEGFKAVTDLIAPLSGCFHGGNPALVDAVEVVKTDPYGAGWLYLTGGEPGQECRDAPGYAAWLDETIDRMTGTTS